MDRKIKRAFVIFIYIFASKICMAQVNYSFFKVEEGVQYSIDKGLTWSVATERTKIRPDAMINNPLGKRFALINNTTDAVYWCEQQGMSTIPEIIKSVIKQDKYFIGLFSEVFSSDASENVRYSRRGGIKRGEDNVYIENVVAHELKNDPLISVDVKFNIIPVTKHTFYFDVENNTDAPLQFLIVQYDKKTKIWYIAFNYKNADEEIVLTIPAKTKIELKNQEFKNNKNKEYYLVALDEGLKLSWQNLLINLNTYDLGVNDDISEPTLYIYSNN